jgi:hypothetical protein
MRATKPNKSEDHLVAFNIVREDLVVKKPEMAGVLAR